MAGRRYLCWGPHALDAYNPAMKLHDASILPVDDELQEDFAGEGD